jgi:hypothetical protein
VSIDKKAAQEDVISAESAPVAPQLRDHRRQPALGYIPPGPQESLEHTLKDILFLRMYQAVLP